MNNLSEDFKKSILSSAATNLAKDYTEIALDSILKDGVIKDIPIIGTIASLYKIGYSIRERFTIRKIATFLHCLNDISAEEKEQFMIRLNDDDKQGDIFEKLLLIIDRVDDAIKSEIIGNLFRIYILDVFSKNTFLRCCNVIERAYVDDLMYLHKRFSHGVRGYPCTDARFESYMDYSYESPKEIETFYNLGLMIREPLQRKKHGGNDGQTEIYYKTDLNSIGKSLTGFMFYDLNSDNFKRYMERVKKDHHQMRDIYKRR